MFCFLASAVCPNCYSESVERKVVSFKGIIVSRSQKAQKSGSSAWKVEPELERLGMSY